MKLFNLSLIAAVFGQSSTDERKVPPRTPDQRLTFLNNRMMDWIEFNFRDRRSGRTDSMVVNIQKQVTDKIGKAFNDRKCASWSKEWLPHGGPNPNGPMGNVSWKDHRKSLVTALADRIALKAAQQSSQRRRRETTVRTRRDIMLIDDDVFDEYFIHAASDGERSADRELERALSNDQRVRLYQILVNYMKWAWRYLSDCPNDTSTTHAVRIYDVVENTLIELYDILNL